MAAIDGVFGWLGRKALLYLAIVAAILAGALIVPWIKAGWSGPAIHLDRAARLDAVRSRLEAARVDAQQGLAETAKAAQRKSIDELDQAIAAAEQARVVAVAGRRSGLEKATSLATMDTDALLKDGRRELDVQLLDRKIAGLTAARDRLAKRNIFMALTVDVRGRINEVNRRVVSVREAERLCRLSSQALGAFEDQWLVWVTKRFYVRARHTKLKADKKTRCDDFRLQTAADQARRGAVAVAQQKRADAARAYRGSRGWVDSSVTAVTGDLEQRITAERTAAEGSWRAKLSLWARQIHLVGVLKKAAIALTLIIASPYLIRLLFFFVLAPIAMRRPAILLRVPGGRGAAIPPSDRSATSVGVRLEKGEELLVRQDYLQSTARAGAKSTRWLLDWRHPFSSIATGLFFLTRVRGDGEATTVSAVRDPFAEVAVLTLPDNASCVLQPRALAAVAQPIGRSLRITSHWRVSSLNAWATLQLRFLVLHGPARLVIKGGRGVRVERAETGRVFGQDQLVGFSADLAYAVTRTETFWPYFFGREQLFKDEVRTGDGVLIVEEAPMAGRRGGGARRGLEGAMDAALKMVGL